MFPNQPAHDRVVFGEDAADFLRSAVSAKAVKPRRSQNTTVIWRR